MLYDVKIVDADMHKRYTGVDNAPILANLKNIRKGKTTILIAHRISTVENMDKIIYVEGGRVTAFGTHEELLGSCESYRNLVELQKLDDANEGDLPSFTEEVSANA